MSAAPFSPQTIPFGQTDPKATEITGTVHDGNQCFGSPSSKWDSND